jgi:hypothetical protein
MSFDETDISNKMTTSAPAKKEYHFSGDGIYHNLTILASNIEEATKAWLERRKVLPSSDRNAANFGITQSTPDEKAATDAEV